MLRTTIVGAAGYAGVELTRLVLGHPSLELVNVTSNQDAGRSVSDLYPALASCELVYQEHSSALSAEADLVFLAVPHTAAMAVASDFLEAGAIVVDASADFRLLDPAVYAEWYATPHTAPELLGEAVYGLPELWRQELQGSRLVACPGCYPTATLLALAPAISAGLVESPHVVVDAKSGISGAGRSVSPATHYVNAADAVTAYKVGTHRHTPEILQGMSRLGLEDARLTFAPHLVPMIRGILATCYVQVAPGVTGEDVHGVYARHYAGEPFILLHSLGEMPSTAEVRGSNRAHIGLALDARSGTLVVSSAIDNLVKGTAGQAVQCANIVLGFAETEGLDHPMPAV